MGTGICFCRSGMHLATLPTHKSTRSTIEQISLNNPSALDLERIRRYYEVQRESMNRKTSTFFEYVLQSKQSEVTEIAIKLTNLGTVGARNLAVVLHYYAHITSLKLWKTRLGPEGSSIIAAGLASMSNLTSLSLEDNQMCLEGILALSKVLPRLHCLKELWLPINGITAKAAITLAQGIGECNALASLNLDENYIESEGFCALLSVLSSLPAFTYLSAAYNSISSFSVPNLEHFLKSCARKGSITLSGNPIAREDRLKLAAIKGSFEVIID